jgi:hypothetical protein
MNAPAAQMKWRVTSPAPASWSVESPSGNRGWTGLPTQPAAFALAQSLAYIDRMLHTINHQPTSIAARAPEYGCYRVPPKTR